MVQHGKQENYADRMFFNLILDFCLHIFRYHFPLSKKYRIFARKLTKYKTQKK